MAGERFSLDSNVLVYAYDRGAPAKLEQASTIIAAAARNDCWLTNQALGEFFAAATRKLAVPPAEAAAQVREWFAIFPTIDTSRQAFDAALTAAESRRFAFWDALLLAAAAEAGCTVVLSEDMHEGARFGSLTVRSPFGANGLSAAARRLLDL